MDNARASSKDRLDGEAAPPKKVAAPKAPVKQSPKIAAVKQQSIDTKAINN